MQTATSGTAIRGATAYNHVAYADDAIGTGFSFNPKYDKLNFDGVNDYIDLSAHTSSFSLTAGQPFEIEATIKTTDATYTPSNFPIGRICHLLYYGNWK